MKQAVMLSIRGRQSYQDQEPDVIELVTDGILEQVDGGWNISYEESDLTGLGGVTTTFRVEPDKIILSRTGKLNSQMIFQEGMTHDSLYQADFGALMISVTATKICGNVTQLGGVIDLEYKIEIEQSAMGTIDYHLDIKPKE
ncbi:MAG: DUF1934 domain-containing protein [Oscillospiraceae bacterium]|nr:DUF1934 domain-containing protein [Oscillospiraceae bacterium]